MRRRRWLIALPLSTALHAVGLLALLWLVWRTAALPVLFVDLSMLDVGRESSVVPARDDRPTGRGERGSVRAPAAAGGGAGSVMPTRISAPSRPGPPPPVGHDAPDPDTPGPDAPPAEVTRAPSPPRAEHEAAPTSMAEPARAPAPTISERAAVTADPSARDPVPAWSPSASPSQTPSAPRASGTGESGRRGAAVGGGPGPAGTGRGPGSDEGSGGRGPGGASLVASTGGPGTGSAEYGAYLAQWRRRIHENLRYPLAARRRSLTGTVQIEIVIEPSGAVASVDIAESSSHHVLDQAAMEAVRSLPALPFPPHLVPRPLRARLPVVFDLR